VYYLGVPKPKPIVIPPRTIWEALDEEVILNPPDPVDFTGVVYPKRPKATKRVDPYDLPNLPTKVLLQYLDGARANDGEYNPSWNWGSQGNRITIEAIKAELANRPHVHNKKSGSEARRKASQEHHGSRRRKR
jgi:hypothetical protein